MDPSPVGERARATARVRRPLLRHAPVANGEIFLAQGRSFPLLYCEIRLRIPSTGGFPHAEPGNTKGHFYENARTCYRGLRSACWSIFVGGCPTGAAWISRIAPLQHSATSKHSPAPQLRTTQYPLAQYPLAAECRGSIQHPAPSVRQYRIAAGHSTTAADDPADAHDQLHAAVAFQH